MHGETDVIQSLDFVAMGAKLEKIQQFLKVRVHAE